MADYQVVLPGNGHAQFSKSSSTRFSDSAMFVVTNQVRCGLSIKRV